MSVGLSLSCFYCNSVCALAFFCLQASSSSSTLFYDLAPEIPPPCLSLDQVSTLCRLWVELRAQWGHVALKLARLQNAMDMLLHEAQVPRSAIDQLIAADRKADEIALLQQVGTDVERYSKCRYVI